MTTTTDTPSATADVTTISTTTVDATYEDAFNQKCDALRELLRLVEQSGLLARYNLAKEVKAIMDNKLFGDSAVEKMAKKLQHSAENLYAHASVAEAWSEKEFKKYAKRCQEPGVRVFFSHFVELAPLDREVRDAFLERCFTEKLSVRALKKEKAELLPPADSPKRLQVTKPAATTAAAVDARPTVSFADLAGYAQKELARLDDSASAEEVERVRQECAELKGLVAQLEERLRAFPVPSERDLAAE